MPVATVEYYSNLLQTRTWYSVILPYADVVGPPPYGVVLMLHGRYGNHSTWMRYTKVVLYAEYMPVMLVMPDGGNSRWSNEIPSLPYESWVMEELHSHVQQVYRVREDMPWAVSGLSMGGDGALRLGLKYPDKFCSVWGHSPGLETEEKPRPYPIDDAMREDLDVDLLAAQAVRSGVKLPRLSFDCGTGDWLVERTRRLHQYFLEIGLPHQYLEHPGGHDWDYWDAHVRDGLQQHLDVFGVKASPQAAAGRMIR